MKRMGLGMKFVIYKCVNNSDQNCIENEFETQEREIQSYLDNHAPEDYHVIDGFTDLQNSHRPELEKAVIQALHSGATLLVARADCLMMKASFLARQHGLGNLTVKIAQNPNVVAPPRPAAKAAIPRGHNASHKTPSNSHADHSDRPTGYLSLPLKSTVETAPSSTGELDIWSLLQGYRKKTPSTRTSERATPCAVDNSGSGSRPRLKKDNSNTGQMKTEWAATTPVPSHSNAVQFSFGHSMDRLASHALHS